ncbi:glycine/D-amino acid oxidase-like deaminating enzyme [Microbacteriaceae bacterium SG_E_30_P1]|uniref:Glycine/D-amino acid oxidase-like deaminating enzyme n=1 Tax=Antiquaquibacter oligotrophicus TaxID=2880260 RepID=A0ABT6KLI2_9MICO|nr:FAD-binding oxidoreductase [Antiquaquibacter oligotrophicus]MDH6180565.1 glycine/D-amino acid oxidase-like deaminating enzyme [Antiquaquibacter oligotrophicus]UDF13702.1 FAD-binding oxidoreductase [Antiquaquibacter oligotrophicus]
MDAAVGRYRGLSFWHDSVPDDLTPRAPLPGDIDADVAIIGGGLTGLWTAWYLLDRDPTLRVVVLEKEVVGFGASGRNGGWCSALFPRSTESLVRAHGLEAALAMRRAMIETVDEVGLVTASAGLDINYVKGGTVAFARSAAQWRSAQDEVADAARYGVDQLELWGPERVRAAGARGASFDPACARIHPARLVRGLGRLLEGRGATIFEGTEVTGYTAGEVTTAGGRVRAETVVRALEGYTASLRQDHRAILPLYSLMIATEPLSEAVWDEMGISHGQTFTDHRHLVIYGQRTADNRIAFGGRGARYHWGSAIRDGYDRVDRVFDHLSNTLRSLFPGIGSPEVTHRWGGPLGVPRDWHASVTWDRRTRIATAGGYVGDGLSTTNLAGRTLADLIVGHSTNLTRLPWVDHHSPTWEPEPLRFIGANAGLLAMTAADAEERVTGKPSIAARVMAPLVGGS